MPRVAVTPTGGCGKPAGVTPADGSDLGELPEIFRETTVNVYTVPLIRPVTSQVFAGPMPTVFVHVLPPGLAVTTNELTGSALSIGGVHRTVTFWSPRVPMTAVGAAGNGNGVTVAEASDATELPTALIARTVKV